MKREVEVPEDEIESLCWRNYSSVLSPVTNFLYMNLLLHFGLVQFKPITIRRSVLRMIAWLFRKRIPEDRDKGICIS